ncbi:WxL domain-containing protein [Vagococcus hydrophili]|uniref:WxL domain-containing protein n=1 Tax=Vagococcus hydrophili TaxID=2714947 RepID=A0A6G8AT90_9ENTE|nr:WxL domain-containing protein [Vagococcus hydrophili]QIL48216.1 WxL domain-containing protein [Vagococcus hydrophili]
MKSTKLVTTAAVATLGLTLLAPSVLAAGVEEAKELNGKGTIEYVEDNGPVDPIDPEIVTPIVDPPGEKNDKAGSLRVDFISQLNFKGDGADGKAKITTNQGKYNAAEATYKKDINGVSTDVKRGNWVQVTDKRTLNDEGIAAGWTLSAKLSKQFTTGKSTLNGATIAYNNPYVSMKTATGMVESDQVKTVAGNVLKLDESKVMANAEKGKGFGTYTVEYGRPAADAENANGFTEDTKTSHKSVELTVPANTPLQAGKKYEAEITWTMAEL